MDYLRHPGEAAGFTPLGEVLRAWVRKAPEPRRAAALWALVTGPQISRRSRVRGVAGGRLEVTVSDESWRDALQDMASDLLRRMNRAAGDRNRYRALSIEVG
jgi:predicted nucleic acid-binding Zn ribbon protein